MTNGNDQQTASRDPLAAARAIVLALVGCGLFWGTGLVLLALGVERLPGT